MEHFKILKRALETTWRYKALWVFGILLALTSGSSGGSGNAGNAGNASNAGVGDGFSLPPEAVTVLIVMGIVIAIFVLLLIAFSVVMRYLGENALILMVDEHEETGVKHTIKEGFRMAWSRSAFQLFLLDLVITLPLVIVSILLFIFAAVPLLGWATGSRVAGVVGTVVAIGAFFIVLFLVIAVSVVVGVLMHFIRRVLVLQALSLFEAIREGYQLVRRHLGDVALMWLLMLGIGIGWGLVMIPLMFVFVLLALLVGGVPGVAVGGLLSLALDGPWPWIVGGLVGVPLFILIVSVPSLFLGGLFETFKSTTWTLTYRELLVLEAFDEEPGEGLALEALIAKDLEPPSESEEDSV